MLKNDLNNINTKETALQHTVINGGTHHDK